MAKIKKQVYIIALIIFWLVIVFQNFNAGSVLSGWDNLHPEFNFGVNIQRSLSAVWQEYQGLGLLGGMAHAADLPRQLILWLFSIVLPMNFLRYGWTFAMLLFGPLGVYFFLSKITGNKLSGFTASMFYLFNLATVQYFYVPFEAFVTFYGFLPWLMYAAYLSLIRPSKKTLLAYFFISLAGTSAFYVQTLFIVYVMILGLLCGLLWWAKQASLKNIIVLALITIFTNAFWLLPVLYFSLTKAYVVDTSKINSIASSETRLMNQGFGGPLSIASLKGFWLEYTDARGGEFGYLMPVWQKWTQSVLYNAVSLVLFFVSVLGLAFSFVYKKLRLLVYFIFLVLVTSVLFLSSGKAPLGLFYDLLSKAVPLFAELFRSPFTKWSIPLAFSISIGLGLFVSYFYKKLKIVGFVFAFILTALSLYQVKPIISGSLIHDELNVDLPREHLDLFEFFQNQPKEKRIARFPVQSFWGWDFNDWGYRGSGFLWYGIEQPIMDRAFDVWSRENEAYYFEINNAVYQGDAVLFKKVIDKYQLGYALVDESIIVAGEDQTPLNFEGIYKLLEEIGAEKVFAEGKLKVYKFDNPDRFVQAPNGYTLAEPMGETTRLDPIFYDYGNYISSGDMIYPFWDLGGEQLTYASYQDGFEGERIIFSRKINNLVEYDLLIPPLNSKKTIYLTGRIFFQGRQMSVNIDKPVDFSGAEDLEPINITLANDYSKLIVVIGGQIVKVDEGQVKNFSNAEFSLSTGMMVQVFDVLNNNTIDLSTSYPSSTFQICWEREVGEPEISVIDTQFGITAKTKDAVACSSQKVGQFGELKHFININLPYKSPDGARPHFCLVKEGESECLHEDVYYHTNTSADWSFVERTAVLAGGNTYWLVLSARPPEEKGKTWEIEYQKPEVTVYPLISEVIIEPNLLSHYLVPQRISLQKSQTLDLTFPSNKISLEFAGSGNERNCDLFERGSVNKDSLNNAVIYQAVNMGAMCDFLLTGADTNQEYLFRTVGQQISGRSLKTYLYNGGSHKNDLEVIMDNGEFDNTFSIPSWPWQNEYVLNLEARSFGDETSKIKLDAVNIYHFPLNWVSNFRLIKNEPKIFNNSIKIDNHDKLGTFLYSVDVEAEKGGIVAFSQAYDGGWIAFDKKFSVFKHHEFNSWANAWEVPQGEYTIYIFYWPQLLQFIGFLSLLFVSSYLILKR